jgi:nucleoside-diphosphate-sugar epimerase
MRIFVTGVTGFIGFAVAEELIGAGHQVPGRAPSEAGAPTGPGLISDLEAMRREG